MHGLCARARRRSGCAGDRATAGAGSFLPRLSYLSLFCCVSGGGREKERGGSERRAAAGVWGCGCCCLPEKEVAAGGGGVHYTGYRELGAAARGEGAGGGLFLELLLCC